MRHASLPSIFIYFTGILVALKSEFLIDWMGPHPQNSCSIESQLAELEASVNEICKQRSLSNWQKSIHLEYIINANVSKKQLCSNQLGNEVRYQENRR